MKYFFLSLLAITVLTVGVFGFRGQKSPNRPIRIFPDMDEQDFQKAQKPSAFFHDGMGSRLPVGETVPHASDDGVFPVEFGKGRAGHYYTGAIDDYFAQGMPVELGLTADNVGAFLRRGEDRYQIFCAICHSASGDGKGVVSRYMDAAIANLHEPRFQSDQYPDGTVFDVITNGKGLMGAYGANIPVRDRWAIVAYVRALQASQESAPAGPEAAPAPGTTAASPAPEGQSPPTPTPDTPTS